MNQSPIWSVPASADTLVPFRRVKLVAAGAAYAGAGETAVGTLLPGDPGDKLTSAVQDLEFGVHFAVIGDGTDIAIGDELESAADGKLIKRAAGAAEAIALEACTADGDMIRVKYLGHPRTGRIVASGIHTWVGTAATDTQAVVGLLATDVVIATMVLANSTQYLLKAVNNAAADTIDFTLSAAGAADTCKVSYLVIRP